MPFTYNYVSPNFLTFLDDIGGAKATYALRKLHRQVSDSQCIRVRRNSDNKERDIGFSSGVLDTTTLQNYANVSGTFTNLLGEDGNFETNLDNYSKVASPAISAEQAKYGTKSVKCTCAGASAAVYKDLTITNGNIVYVCSWLYLSSHTSGTNIGANAYDKDTYNNGVLGSATTTILNNWQFVSCLKTASGGGVRVVFGGLSNPTLTGYFDSAHVIDLTATFGAGYEPTKAEMDAFMTAQSSYFASTSGQLGNLNLVENFKLSTDLNSDGVGDGWTTSTGTGNTVTRSIDDSSQKIEITASTGTSQSTLYRVIPCSAGQIFTFLMSYKVQGNVSAKLFVDWYTSTDGSSGYISTSSSSTGTSTSYAGLINTVVAPSTAKSGRFQFGCAPNSSTNTGSVWMKSASITIPNNVYVTTWYDQSGNGNHATQTTLANQPRIVDEGVLNTNENNKPCIYFNGSAHFLDIPNKTLAKNVSEFTINAVFKRPSDAGTDAFQMIAGFSINGGTSSRAVLAGKYDPGSGYGHGMVIRRLDAEAVRSSVTPSTNQTTHIATGTVNYTTGAINNYSEGTAGTAGTTVTTGNTQDTLSTYAGIGGFTSSANRFIGYVGEVIMFQTVLSSANRSKIESNQGTYYGITVTT